MTNGVGRRCVLVVDDEPMIRGLLTRVLERSGYRVLQAVNGRDALARLEENGSPDLVISDIEMPEMGGVQLWQALRARWPLLPILFVTGSGLGPDDLGDSDDWPCVLQKPLSPHAAVAAVRAALAGASHPASFASAARG